MWLDDGVEYIFAESEAMDFGGKDEENDSDPTFVDDDDEDNNLWLDGYWNTAAIEAELFGFTQT